MEKEVEVGTGNVCCMRGENEDAKTKNKRKKRSTKSGER
jgi:hypothetical protein